MTHWVLYGQHFCLRMDILNLYFDVLSSTIISVIIEVLSGLVGEKGLASGASFTEPPLERTFFSKGRSFFFLC